MKLAEALLEKKNLLARIGELQNRYNEAAVIEAGSEPDESAAEILLSLQDAFDKWEELTVDINEANNRIVIEGKGTMMEALARRDSLKQQINHYSAILSALRHRNQNRRYYGVDNGPKMVVAEGIDTKTFIKLVDDLSKEQRLLDAAIQAANWANDLYE